MASSTSVLFVCLGNICRSPLAEAVFRNQLESAGDGIVSKVDSCGTGAYHEGAAPDSRSLAVLKKQKIDGYVHRARKIRPEDFEEFEWIFAMDSENLDNLQSIRRRIAQKKQTEDGLAKVMLFGTFSGKSKNEEVQDPYYGGASGFDTAYEQVHRFSTNFLAELRNPSKSKA